MRKFVVWLIAVLALSGGAADAGAPIINNGEEPQVAHEQVYGQSKVPIFTYEILTTYPHDTADYTEALFMHDGFLYEGTGLHGESRLKIWNLETGEVIRQHALDDR